MSSKRPSITASRDRLASLVAALGPSRTLIVALTLGLTVLWLTVAVVYGALPVTPQLRNRLGGIAAGDFMFFYPVGRMAASGRAADVYQPALLTQAARELFDPHMPELVWAYPPVTSLPLSLLGRQPPPGALCIWLSLILLLLLAVGRVFLGSWRAAPLVLLYPGSAFALFTGQITPLVTFLFAICFVYSPRSSSATGATAGLLILKPHFAPIPTLLAGLSPRRWIGLGWAAAIACSLIAMSVARFGLRPWTEFLSAARHHAGVATTTLPTARLVSLAGALHSVHLSKLGVVCQAVASLFAVFASASALRDRQSRDAISALVASAAVITITPYAFDYDLLFLSVPWLMVLHEVWESPSLARKHFWLWIVLTLLVPATYLCGLYTSVAIGGPIVLCLLGWAWLAHRRDRDAASLV
jgi:hypothetical protein